MQIKQRIPHETFNDDNDVNGNNDDAHNNDNAMKNDTNSGESMAENLEHLLKAMEMI